MDDYVVEDIVGATGWYVGAADAEAGVSLICIVLQRRRLAVAGADDDVRRRTKAFSKIHGYKTASRRTRAGVDRHSAGSVRAADRSRAATADGRT